MGFTKDNGARRKLWSYTHPKGEPELERVQNSINAYLIDGPRVLVKGASRPLSPMLPPVHYGSKPADGGHLVFKATEGKRGYDQDPVAVKYLRRFVGAQEVIHNIDRWCLWLAELTPTDLRTSSMLRECLAEVQKVREKSTKKSTQEAARTPNLFVEIRQPDVPYLCIPIHVGESRRYWTAARMGPEVINGNANFMAPDEDGLLFALIS